MKLIPLTQGMFAKVDDDIYEELIQQKWQARKELHNWYAYGHATGNYKIKLKMHQLILGTYGTRQHVDHINGDGLDNQRSNLRFCTPAQNQQNRRKIKSGQSKYKGLLHNPMCPFSPWRARIKVIGKYKHLGYFSSEREAAIAYNNAALEHFGEFARINQIDDLLPKSNAQ